MSMPSVAILGASSHIAKGLIGRFRGAGDAELHLYTRSPAAVRAFLQDGGAGPGACAIHAGYADFAGGAHDVVINCVGVGTVNRLGGDFSRYFTVTEEYDNLVLAWLRARGAGALYVSFSSGAVYGRGLLAPADEGTENCIPVNHVAPEDYYAIARINAEAKHRAHTGLRIVDLRIFAYFSRFIDLGDAYFVTEVLRCVRDGRVLATSAEDMVRDYLHPDDLYAAVRAAMAAGAVNAAYDVTSARPVAKSEILALFAAAYGLRFTTEGAPGPASATGAKAVYCSAFGKAEQIGYRPRYTSLETIALESRHILGGGVRP